MAQYLAKSPPAKEASESDRDLLADQLRRAGAPQAHIDAQLAVLGPQQSRKHVEVWRPNVDAVSAFIALSSQWRRVGMDAIRAGLDYAAVESTLRLLGYKRKRRQALFLDLRVMENAAVEIYAAEAKRRQDERERKSKRRKTRRR